MFAVTAQYMHIASGKRVTNSAKQHVLGCYECEISAKTGVLDALFGHKTACEAKKMHAVLSVHAVQ
jgi:hypothetical protein